MMASSSSSFSFSSANINPQVKYDVFVSFRGEDTRDNFTSHLYAALCRKKIEIFVDNQLKRGGEISTSLLDASEGSKISVIVFSKHYAPSRWCFDELVKILNCKKKFTGKNYKEKFQKWRTALREAADLSGFQSHDVRNLGHWQYRQDTIAGALFKKHSRHFEGTYFAQDVGEAEKTGRLAHLRQELLSTLLNDGNAKIIPNIRLNFQSKVLTELRYLYWHGYPSKSLPPVSHIDSLISLQLRESKDLVNLTDIDLNYSRQLKKPPDLSQA
ncbi:hypothetical protein WN944_015363 [Citrus x changshan-huyou]|uniref:TIR domain-containing protein n=1 Tax=Citrus x changshan-huyou TaxID=2935761 RepID=A0AAP0QR14_9ROSI